MTSEGIKNKGKLIEKYIGKEIAPYEFVYKGYIGDTWRFERKKNQVIQTIAIYQYRFDRGMLSFDLFTNVRGKGLVQAAAIEGIETNSYLPGFWKYEDEETFISLLKYIGRILVEKGIAKLDYLSEEPEIVVTDEMYHVVYERHAELCERFIEKTGILENGFDEANIDCWFEVIDERIEVLRKGEYNAAKEELMEMAAFLGEQLVKYMGGKWQQFIGKDYESCSVQNLNSTKVKEINCLGLLAGVFKGRGIAWIKEEFQEVYETRVYDVKKRNF